MTKPNKAHITLGNYDFFIDEQLGDPSSTWMTHYNHKASVYLANRTDITGKPGRQNVRPDVFYFAQDDWSGGLGQKFYDPNKPTKYYRGNGNPRVAGYLTGDPDRSETSSPTGDYMGGPIMASGGGYLYMVNADSVDVGHKPTIYQTSDMATWSSAEMIAGGTGDPNWNRNITCDMNGNAYVSLGGATVLNRIIRVKKDLSSVLFHDETAHATSSNLGARGLAVHEGKLYCWTGINLYQWTLTDAPPATPTRVGSAGDDSFTMAANADCCNCGDGVVAFTSMPGRSNVFQYRRTVQGSATPAFSQLWNAPADAILWSITAMNGVAYVAGNQNRGVTVWAIDLASSKVAPVVRITPDQEGVTTL